MKFFPQDYVISQLVTRLGGATYLALPKDLSADNRGRLEALLQIPGVRVTFTAENVVLEIEGAAK